jgi:hypothetical protein
MTHSSKCAFSWPQSLWSVSGAVILPVVFIALAFYALKHVWVVCVLEKAGDCRLLLLLVHLVTSPGVLWIACSGRRSAFEL